MNNQVDSLFDVPPWPWQRAGVSACIDRIDAGHTRPWCVTGPTGTGKSKQMVALIKHTVARANKAALYVSRNLLYKQTIENLDAAGIAYGCRGARFGDMEDSSAPVQICSVSTEQSRVLRKRDKAVEYGKLTPDKAKLRWALADADVVLVDEIHMNTGPTMARIISDHLEHGAQVICFTATPMGISHLCDDLIVAGTKREGREHGALVPAIVYGSAELDTSKIKRNVDGEFSDKVKRQIWSNQIFGYILQDWKRLNPDARMTLGFGPDVAGSVWLADHFHSPGKFFAEHEKAVRFLKLGREWQVAAATEFYRHGVSAAHIDGTNVWADGKEYKNDESAREDVLARWKANEIKVMWNRWVLREGLDFPDLYHGILAAPIGKCTTYDQIVGRFIRKSEATPDAVIIQDHAANYFRHGSPNHDRDWQELFDLPVRAVTDLRFDDLRESKIKKPIICRKCGAYRTGGPKCHQCGHESSMTSRLVLQSDGSLREVQSNGLRPRNTTKKANTQKLWDDMYWAARNAHGKLQREVTGLQKSVDAGDKLAAVKLEAKQETLDKKLAKAMTFNQVYSMFWMRHGYFPPKTLANMPEKNGLWYRRVLDTNHEDVRMPQKPTSNKSPAQETLDLESLPVKPF